MLPLPARIAVKRSRTGFRLVAVGAVFLVRPARSWGQHYGVRRSSRAIRES
jgi:hypothetical protein